MSFREKLANRAKNAGIAVEKGLEEPLEAYFSLLRKWNLKVSLTSLDVESFSDEAIDRLLIEPLVAANQFPPSARSWVDVGSGGGSPAIPLKLVRPAATLHMVESKTRKAAFLREVVRQLNLEEANVQNVRANELSRHPLFSASMDILTVRAVKLDATLLADADLFLRPGGIGLLFQSQAATPGSLAPLIASRTVPLIPSRGSQLVVLEKPA